MKKYFLLLLLASAVHSQTISPLTNECSNKCSGSFSIANNGLRPLNVVLEKHGFDVAKDGQVRLTPLPAGIEIQLGATSIVIPTQGTHTFFYKAVCAQPPCHAEILALLSSGERTNEGLKLTLALPHILYVCEKKKDCRLRTLRSLGYDPTLQARK